MPYWLSKRNQLANVPAALGSGGSAAASTHTHTGPNHSHQWFQYEGVSAHDKSYNSGGSDVVADNTASVKTTSNLHGLKWGEAGSDPNTLDGEDTDLWTSKDGTGATGAANAYYQEVAAFTKDTYT